MNAGSPQMGLFRFVIGSKPFLGLSAADVTSLKTATSIIREICEIEQKFDILIENFIEMEQEFATRTVHSAYRSDASYAEFMDHKQIFNRRLVNLLTAARLYVDQTKHHLGEIFHDDADEAAKAKALFSSEFDAVFGYRVLEGLRNYVQHRGLPIHSLSINAEWRNQKSDDRELEFNIAVKVNVAELEQDRKFRSETLAEMKTIGESIDVKPLSRAYIEALGRIHETIRKIVSDREATAIALVELAMSRFESICDEERPRLGLCVGTQNVNGTRTRSFHLSLEFLDYVRGLRTRGRALGSLAQRTISTRALKSKENSTL
jgi:hypothetical protein